MRERMSLNDEWSFYPDISDYLSIKNRLNELEKEIVDIPHTVKMLPYNYFNEEEYQFKSLYRKEIFIDERHIDQAIFLQFEGVANMAIVYVNGVESFYSESPFLPFCKEISKELRFGQMNTIDVVVDSREIEWIPPFGGVVDFLTYGGIYREVSLSIRSRYFIQNIFAFSSDVLKEEKSLTVQTVLSADHGGSIIYKLYEGTDWDNLEKPMFSSIRNVEDKRIRNTLKVSGVKLWDIYTPNLYTLEVVLVDRKGNAVDRKLETIGFREAKFTVDGFYLNGNKIKLVGLNRHQCYPYAGYAMPKSMQILDADILKNELGVNIVRTSHYPQSKHFLRRCDEIGLLVFEEIPGWQHIGDEHFKENSKDNLKKMLKRDRNHPSIVIWGVRINESQDDHVFYTEMNKISHIYDESRQTGGVRNFAGSEFLEDVYTYNDFIHKGDNEALSLSSHILTRKAPYLVTEFNGHMFPTKSTDPESRRTEHAMRHARVLGHMMKDSKISGAIGWCMADYNTHGDFGSGDRICYHGVLDMFRQRKPASYVYSSQKEDEPVLHVSSAMNIGDHSGGNLGKIFAFTNCDYVEVYKDDKFVRRFMKDMKQGLKHPPIALHDLIGDLLITEEGFSKTDSRKTKTVIRSASEYGLNLPLAHKITMGIILMKYKMKMSDAIALFSRYYAGWGEDQSVYTFKGYSKDKEVISVTRGGSRRKVLSILPSKTQLDIEETYDVAMVSIHARDEHGQVLVYSNEVIHLVVEGDVSIIGPEVFPLRGGQSAFYVRSGRTAGEAKVRIISETMGEQEIVLDIRDIRCPRL